MSALGFRVLIRLGSALGFRLLSWAGVVWISRFKCRHASHKDVGSSGGQSSSQALAFISGHDCWRIQGSHGHMDSLGIWGSVLATFVLGFGVPKWAGFILSFNILAWA